MHAEEIFKVYEKKYENEQEPVVMMEYQILRIGEPGIMSFKKEPSCCHAKKEKICAKIFCTVIFYYLHFNLRTAFRPLFIP